MNVLGEDGKLLTLTKVHLVPELNTRLLSALHLTSKGYEIMQRNTECVVYKPGRGIFMKGEKHQKKDNNLIEMNLTPCPLKASPKAAGEAHLTSVGNAIDPWFLQHQRMGHTGLTSLKRVAQQGLVNGMQMKSATPQSLNCEACMMGKATKTPFPHASQTEVKEPLSVVSLEFWVQ